jgi:hypothetical protein
MKIYDWSVVTGRLRGTVTGPDGERKWIQTSPIVGLQDRVVTTLSGSKYELGKCNPCKPDEEWLKTIRTVIDWNKRDGIS